MKTEKLVKYLNTLAKAYAEGSGADDYYFYTEKSRAHYQVTAGEQKLEFIYYTKGSKSEPVSTLTCRVFPDRDKPYFYEIQEIIDYLDILDYHCYFFPYIENEKRMRACFNYLTDFVEYRAEELKSLKQKDKELITRKLSEIERVFGFDKTVFPSGKAEREQFIENLFSHYSAFLTARYTSNEAYLDYVRGNYKKALKEYEKLEEKTGYEEKLIAFMKERFAPYQAVSEDCASILAVERYTKSDNKTFIILIAGLSLTFCLIFFIAQLIINLTYINSTRFVSVANPFINALIGLFPGVVTAILFRRRLEPFIHPNKKEALEFYDLINTYDGIKIPHIATAAAVILSIFIFIGVCRPSIAIYDEYMNLDKGDSIFTDYETYLTEDIDRLVLVEGYYKDKNFTEYVENPKYAFTIKGGGYIMLEDFNLNEKKEKELISVLYPGMEGYKVQTVFSVEEIK